MIRLEQVTVAAGDFTLRDVSLSVATGQYAVVIGPTGSGKTTLLEAIAGHHRARSGQIIVADREVTRLQPEARGTGMVYQQYHLFPHRTVRQNIEYGLARRNMTRRGRDARVSELAELLDLEPLLNRSIAGLSGGEQQRIAVARALAPRPRVLLLDEPFAAVDPATRRRLRDRLRELHTREAVTTLHVTHDFEEALHLADTVAVLSRGVLLQQGTADQVFQRPASPEVAEFVGSGTVMSGRVVPCADGDGGPFAARFETEGLSLEVIAERTGPTHALVRAQDVTLSRAAPSDSARNHLPAKVQRLERTGPVTRVFLDVGRPLTALITTESIDRMALAPGDDVIAAVKATAVHLF
ncbi:MAG TPA: ABC transporter ATP-binding protein [Gemmatimonadales bacterium]|nr:ABC transporter ATP-binding protein [Gemmatimonadales bacterium]